ncbi:MAG: ABC transporter ATP-binding protein [Bacteroidales bacterium]|nr:ABC transporter ATP-binding protein [Bacteroidales bacterium]
MSETAIKFENISKQYRLGLVSTKTLSHDLNRWWQTSVLGKDDPYLKIGEVNDRSIKAKSDYVWALKDIDFEVKQGEVLGIIGKNGAGKSTLLKILSKVTSPTTGRILAKGRIASLLEVGTGFHPELTGRENIYMNGAILGMTKAEITRKLDEIVDFSGVERYLDTPAKRYSSGMTVRLGFAIAAHLEPEILVVDEVLAVGDAEFQKKAIGKMQDVSKGEGRTVLFVSHNMASMKSLCQNGILLENGMISYRGKINDVVENYIKKSTDIFSSNIIDNVTWQKHTFHIENILINNSTKSSLFLNNNTKTLDITVKGNTEEDIMMDIAVKFRDKDGTVLATYSPGLYLGEMYDVKTGNFSITDKIKLPEIMSKGVYMLDVILHRPMMEFYLKAPSCCELVTEGYQGKFGRSLIYADEGFIGLDRVN